MKKTETRTQIDATVTVDFDELQKLLGIDTIKHIDVYPSMSDNPSKIVITTKRYEK